METTYFIFRRGERLSFRHRTNGQERNFTLASLGKQYTEESLRRKIYGLTKADTCPLPGRANPNSYSAKLRDIKSMFAAMDIMDEQRVSSQSEYLNRLSELRSEKREALTALKEARETRDYNGEEALQRRIATIETERAELMRMRATVGKKQKGEESIDR